MDSIRDRILKAGSEQELSALRAEFKKFDNPSKNTRRKVTNAFALRSSQLSSGKGKSDEQP
jgi:hypothetical protein